MPNIASVLKSEIARVSRREIRAEISSLQKTVSGYRSQIAALRRQMHALEKALKRSKPAQPQSAPEETEEGQSTAHRFSAKGFASHRQRLGLSAAAMAQLLGVSALSVYKWESGKTKPRAKQIEAIASIRSMGRREALAKLENLGERGPRRRRASS